MREPTTTPSNLEGQPAALPRDVLCRVHLTAVSTHQRRQMKVADVAQRVAAYGFPGFSVDGDNPAAVYQMVAPAGGVLSKILRGDNETAPVGAVIGAAGEVVE